MLREGLLIFPIMIISLIFFINEEILNFLLISVISGVASGTLVAVISGIQVAGSGLNSSATVILFVSSFLSSFYIMGLVANLGYFLTMPIEFSGTIIGTLSVLFILGMVLTLSDIGA